MNNELISKGLTIELQEFKEKGEMECERADKRADK